MAAVGFDLYSRLLAEAVEEQKAKLEGRSPIVEPPQAVIDLPIEAHLPDDYVPDEAQKLELYRRLARARTRRRHRGVPPGGHRSLRADAARRSCGWWRSPSCGWRRRRAGVSSISREEGQLVVRFGGSLSRSAAMRLLGDGGLPGVRPGDLTFASNQVRIRVPPGREACGELTQAVVARLARRRRLRPIAVRPHGVTGRDEAPRQGRSTRCTLGPGRSANQRTSSEPPMPAPGPASGVVAAVACGRPAGAA